MDTKLKLTDTAIIDLLGGTAKVARMCKVDPAAVSNWRIRGIPADKYMLLGARIEKESHGLVTRKDLFPNSFWLIWPELLEKSNAFGLQQEED
jgi:DNA-binding transcriptional regulator YdaS (Cro superfamily)